jgi:hypothetical protein
MRNRSAGKWLECAIGDVLGCTNARSTRFDAGGMRNRPARLWMDCVIDSFEAGWIA